jgi:prevent-host-death family protein
MQATVLDLRRNTRSILAALARNERVTLTNRGRRQAVIVPCANQSRPSAAEHAAFGLWKDRDDLSDVAEHVRQLRKGRSF